MRRFRTRPLKLEPLESRRVLCSNATTISVPSTTEGEISNLQTEDCFALDLSAGQYTLRIDAAGQKDITLRAADGVELAQGIGTPIFWSADGAASVFVEVSGTLESYSLVVYADDHGNQHDDATSVGQPELVNGAIEVNGDIDFFSFSAEAHRVYQVSLESDELSEATLRVIDAQGNLVTGESDQRVNWIASGDGPYHFEVADESTAGTYTLSVEQFDAIPVEVLSTTPASIDQVDDVDVYTFEATAGATYDIYVSEVNVVDTIQLELLDSSGQLDRGISRSIIPPTRNGARADPIGWTAGRGGVYAVFVSRQTRRPVAPDLGYGLSDYSLHIAEREPFDLTGDDASNSTPIQIPSVSLHEINFQGDRDFFSFNATAGVMYDIFAAPGSMDHASISLFDTDGATPLQFIGSRKNYRVEDGDIGGWIAPRNGEYFISVSTNEARFFAPGAYALHIAEVEYDDDYGNLPRDATRFSLPATVNGELEQHGDRDSFSFEVSAGESYVIESSMPIEIMDQSGRVLLAPNRWSLTWRAESDGLLYIDVRDVFVYDNGRHWPIGPYSLQITSGPDVLSCDYFLNGDGCDLGDLLAVPRDLELIDNWLQAASDPTNPKKDAAHHVYKFGDTDLDGDVDSDDLGATLNMLKQFGQRSNSTTSVRRRNHSWFRGDFNQDSVFNTRDLGLLLNNFGFTSPELAATAALVERVHEQDEACVEPRSDRLDTNGDGVVTPLDALIVINRENEHLRQQTVVQSSSEDEADGAAVEWPLVDEIFACLNDDL